MNPFLKIMPFAFAHSQLRNYTMFQIMNPCFPKHKPFKLLAPPKCLICQAPKRCHKINNKIKRDAAVKKAIKQSIEFR
jgi:hypothetical protein